MKLSKYTKFRQERFGGVLFETRSEKVFALNPTATALVRALGGGGEIEHVLEQLRGEFSDPDDTIERDARAFIAQLQQQGLLEE